ncbi:Fe(2+) transporter permease subunit FeoB [Rhodobacter sphaeroides]|jgi:ferrous iron transport protein B|uniref:Ferrous iron transport protein B n=1 Tax=Cereibacter sphaeroides (strain ATCC 17023 / DSM 158 / JCM 6121 / CCUG 31486 / LMG 2827 / NBRC 12203 / NCIMB 8253 / ATH 2.4.1.) TaxID=272943 RepID=Q3J5G9_CERS4|nr:Fe(2+) transporter permease subunit FeoB [Cereibacter sphaeroides]ABA77965.1 Fe2+ transport system protein B [Cereibacter sphaeroides 2.4.1]AMJ46348.1 iron transporter FeoB [Cereibacter sphaeroides]ANS33059.1 ferrous iron transporter B [Cereibacter sphaeroides]AXC60201.1 Fe(2+) transporter permease subunit FeoB [Cereibacter sphaeroides 2.4.1]MVX48797.1 Fe(2+) transporter permease subunit FeoB [Cereibacter sphaeroides]
MSGATIALLGNPNCGKTTLFNALTGTRQMVGNWPGVTVEKKTGEIRFAGRTAALVDLPGTYSLGSGHTVSTDERIARDFALSGEAQLVVNIVDASNIERNLYLTLQILEMGVPVVVALNMMDIAASQRIEIDLEALAARLGCPVVPIVAATGRGIEELKAALVRALDTGVPAVKPLSYVPEIEAAVADLVPAIEAAGETRAPRWLALELLEGSRTLIARVPALAPEVARARQALEEALGYDPDTAIASGRYDAVAEATAAAVRRTSELGRTLSDRIDRVVLNRVLGIPIFLFVMYLMFLFTINVGSAFIDFFDVAAATIFVEGTAELLGRAGSPDWLTTVLASGVGGGVQTVATFIPVIACLFLFLSVLEDSGYMARAAFVMDRFMRIVGLPGKSFVPLIVGFGCNVPAVMATRTLENERDRTMTIAMAPFMSCGARLPVYALFAAAFFPANGQNLVFLLYLIGILAAVFTGLVLKNTLLPGSTTPFVMELPPYHIPTLRAVLLRTWDRLKSFVIRAGRVLVPVVAVIAVLNSWGRDGSFGNEDTDNSVLAAIGQTIAPAFEPMGLRPENWPATVGIFTGLLAKEAVVGTLNALYSGMGETEEAQEEAAPYSLTAGLSAAVATIGENFGDLADALTDPLGIEIGDLSSTDAAAEELEVSTGTFGAMRALFDGQAGAFAYLLMVLLYVPCTAAIAAVWREAGPAWTGFVSVWTLMMGWGSATVYYQAATFARHPEASALWIGGVLAAFALVILVMKRIGGTGASRSAPAGA